MLMQERKKNPSAFLRNIFQILNNPQLAEIIEWAPMENGFVIKDLQKFQSMVLPQFFKHKKYSSFVRQLNMYGFHKQRNCAFQNCFLHDQFRRGDELPVDIKRKPEKKKKVGQQMGNMQIADGNWLSFSQQLRRHFPHIADNILVSSETVRRNVVLKSEGDVGVDQDRKQQMEDDSGSQQYISKISLKGLIQEQSSCHYDDQKHCQQWDKQNLSHNIDKERSKSYQQNEIISYKYMKQQSQLRGNDELGEKRCFSFLRLEDDKRVGSFMQERSEQNTEKFNYLSTVSLSFLDNTLQSLAGMSQVLLRQNEILQKTHPLIRNVVLKSQTNKIAYLNAQVESLQNDQQHTLQSKERLSFEEQIQKVLDDQKQQIVQLTCFLEQQVQGLSEFVFGEEDLPISMTSIKCRLQRFE